MRYLLGLASLAATAVVSKPLNDWSKPCFNGECAYDLPEGGRNGYGTIKIFGSPSSIADITPAAGWVILDCDQNILDQEIRLVCKGDDEAACSHLQQNGPVGKLVRLPEECGAGPFARIASFTSAEDQSIPGHVKITKRADGAAPQAYSLKIDANFDAADTTKVEPVSFILVGGNFPGLSLDLDESTQLHIRDVDSIFDSIKKGISKAANAVKNAVDKINHFDAQPKISKTLDFQKHVDLLNIHQTCGATNLNLDVSVDGKAHADVQVGLVAVGTILPPHMDRFGAFADLTADLEARLLVNAHLQGSIDTGRKRLVQLGIPGFSIPKILTVGPFLEIDGHVTAQLDISLDLDVGIGYHLDGIEIWIPQSAGHSSTKTVSPKNTPLKIAANTNVNAHGTIEGHIIPAVKLGIDGLAGKIKADAYLEVDAYARLQLDAQASASSTKSHRDIEADEHRERSYVPPYDLEARRVAVREAERDDANSFKGCVDLKAGVGISAGGEGSILGLVNLNKQFSIFHKEFQVVKKCWNGGVAKRAISGRSSRSTLEKRRIAAVCPKTAGDLSTVDNETVNSSAIH